MIAVGPENFHAFLEGAHAMDRHFATAPALRNMPIIMGLIGFWHRVVCACPARAVIPYDQRLARLPAYLQQLDMESNGKSVTLDGGPVATPTGPLVWGEPGTNGQHAFFQLLHQGTDTIPVEFIVAANGHEPDLKFHHELLLANCLAQSCALMKGCMLEEAKPDVGQGHGAGGRPRRRTACSPATGRVSRPSTASPPSARPPDRPTSTGPSSKACCSTSTPSTGAELGKELATNLLPVVQAKAMPRRRLDSGIARTYYAAEGA